MDREERRSRDPEETEPAAVKAEAASAAAVLQGLVKAVRGFSMYLPNNPLHDKFFVEFARRLEEHLEQFGDLRLDLGPEGIRCRGELVHSHEDRRENLGFRMHADGLRSLVLAEGIEEREARTLVEIIRASTTEGGEDDIATGLWSADLPHVAYVIAEAPAPPTSTLLPSAGVREAQDGAIRRFAATLAAAPPPTTPPPPPPQVIFTLDERELASLRALLERESARSPVEEVAGILEAVLAGEQETEVLDDLLGIMVKLCGDLIQTGHFDLAARLVGVLGAAGASPRVAPERAARIASARSGVVTAEVLEGLSRQLSGDGVAREQLRALVLGLGGSAVEPFCRLLGEVPAKETRKVLIDGLAETGRGCVDQFLPFLDDSRWYLVRNTVYILRKMGSPEAVRAVRRIAAHRDPRVRKEVLLYLDEAGDAASEPVLLALLSDPVPSLRIGAVRALVRRGSRAAAQQLFALTASPAFEERELPEREAVWEALGELAPARAFDELRRMLLRRHRLSPAKELQETACAAAGLRRIGTPEAVELLRQAAAAKRGAPREAVEKALRALALARRDAAGAEPPGAGGGDGHA